MNCDQALEYISLDLDGMLSDGERRELEAHLAGCGACRSLALELKAIHQAMPEEDEVPAGFLEGVMDRVRADKVVALPVKKTGRWKSWAAMAAVFAVIVVGAGGIRSAMDMGRSASSPAAAAPAAAAPRAAAPAAPPDLPVEAAADTAEQETVPAEAPAPVPETYGAQFSVSAAEAPAAGYSAREANVVTAGPVEGPVPTDAPAPAVAAGAAEADEARDAVAVKAFSGAEPAAPAVSRMAVIDGNGAAEEVWGEPEEAEVCLEDMPDMELPDQSLLMPAMYVSGTRSQGPEEALERLLEEKGFPAGYTRIEPEADDTGAETAEEVLGVTWPREGDTQDSVGYAGLSENGKFYLFEHSRLVWDTADTVHSSRCGVYAVPLDGGEILEGPSEEFLRAIAG